MSTPATTVIPARAMIAVEQVPTEVYASTTGGRRAHQVKAVAFRRGTLLVSRRKGADAKAAFAALVEKMIDTHGAPEVLFFEGFAGICYQMVAVERVTWSYRIVCPDGSPGGDLGGAASMADAVGSCKLHLSQHGTDYHDDASVMRAWRFLNPDQRHDHLRYSASQRAYKYGRDIEGITDPHQWAGDHQHDFLPPLEALARHDGSRPDPPGESRCFVVTFGHDAELAAASRRNHGPGGPFTGRWRLLSATEAAELADAINANHDRADGEARVVQVVQHPDDAVTAASTAASAPATVSQVVEGHSTSANDLAVANPRGPR